MQVPELMVRSLISQLSQQHSEVPTALETLFTSCENGQRQPSVEALLDVLQQMIQEFSQSYIILDALDECNSRAELMDTILETIVGWRLENLHILVTSRKDRDIESSLQSFVNRPNTVCLQSESMDEDIITYIRQRLSNDSRFRVWPDDIRQDIENALVRGAQGMCVLILLVLKLWC